MSGELRENCRIAMAIEARMTGSDQRLHSPNEIGYLAGCVYTRPSDELIAECLVCLYCEAATLDNRLAAAALAMAAAYGDSNADAAHRVVTATSRFAPRTVQERIHALRTELIYEFEFGRTERAVELADTYLDLYKRSSLGRLSQAVRISAYPHRLAGNFEIADQRMAEALSLARRDCSPIDEAIALQWLAMYATDRGDYRAASNIVEQLVSYLAVYPAAASLPVRHTIATVALMVGNDPLAKAQIALAEQSVVALHGRCAILALQLFATMMGGDLCSDDSLAELVHMNDRLEARPGHEGTIITIAMACQQRGNSEQAANYVRRYALESRRESWPSRHPILISFLAGQPLVIPADIRRVALGQP